MARKHKKRQPSQEYDSTPKEWIQQQPRDIIAVLLPGAIYEETLNVEVIKPTVRADKVFKVLYQEEECILHIEFESGADNSMAARLLVYNAILYHEHDLPVISIIVYPFRTKMAVSPLRIKKGQKELLTFHFQTLPLFTLEAEQFVRAHVACMYPLLPVMRGANNVLIQQVLDELAEFYRDDEVTLSQQIVWMQLLLDRTDTVSAQEKYRIQEKLSMYDKLWDENPKVQKIRAESKAEGIAKGKAEGIAEGIAEGKVEGKLEAMQEALITVVESRFPTLTELAEKQAKRIDELGALKMLVRQIAAASDETVVRYVLNTSAA